MINTHDKHVSVHLMGGLGNQLFQIFTCIAYSLREQRTFIFPYSETLKTGISRNTYWDSMLQSLKQYTTLGHHTYTNQTILTFPAYKEPMYTYNFIKPFTQDNILLYGYFQSYKYFIIEWEKIQSFVNFSHFQDDLQSRYSDIFKNNNTSIVSMHFRLGDYLQSQDYHPIMPYEYYYNALCHVKNNRSNKIITCLYFCEQQDNDSVMNIINKLENQIPSILFIKASDDLHDWEQMILMSCCNDNIMANSTFSWWGAFLNKNKNPIICYPEKWFGPKLSHNTRDLFLINWQQISW